MAAPAREGQLEKEKGRTRGRNPGNGPEKRPPYDLRIR